MNEDVEEVENVVEILAVAERESRGKLVVDKRLEEEVADGKDFAQRAQDLFSTGDVEIGIVEVGKDKAIKLEDLVVSDEEVHRRNLIQEVLRVRVREDLEISTIGSRHFFVTSPHYFVNI